MVNLIKYEIRKHAVSKAVILIGFLVLELAFVICLFLSDMSVSNVVLGILQIFMVLGILYTAFEPIAVFENDIAKKQGYLLFMTPNSNTSILGAKLIAGAMLLVSFFTIQIIFLGINDILLTNHYGEPYHLIDNLFNAFGDAGFHFSEYLVTLVLILFLWIDFVTMTFLVTSISYAYIPKGKLNTFVSIVLFFVLLIVETITISAPIAITFDSVGSVENSFIALTILIFIIPALINYYCSVKLLDKKVSL